MAELFSPESFYDGALDFARTALEAHHDENYRRVALDAGTALEHLAKAALARRSPALLAELKNDSSGTLLAWFLRIDGAKTPARVRTIGLWEALTRVRQFVSSNASDDDLRALVDMRDGVVHAAQEAEIETRILTAFVQHADALLADLCHERANFWAEQLGVVDALLADATNKVAHTVAIKLAAAEASYAHEYGSMAPTVARMIRAAREVSSSASLLAGEALMRCPVCESNGIAIGEYNVEYHPSEWDEETLNVTNVEGVVWFAASGFSCRICRLRLDNFAELAEAKLQPRWEVEGADWRDYAASAPWEYDEDAAYDAWREERAEREGWR